MATGAGTYALFGWESTFKTAVTADKLFGAGQKLNRDESNNMKKIYSMGHRAATNIVPTAFTGKAGIEFILSNPWFLRGVFGATPTKTGTGPYTYYYVDTANVNTGGAVIIPNTVPAMTIENGIDIGGSNDPVTKFLGTIIDSCEITCASNQEVKCKVDTQFADITYTKAGAWSRTALDAATTDAPFIYSQGDLKVGGTVIGNVTNATITFKNNLQMITGIGARGASAYAIRQLDTDVKATVYFDSTALLENFYGGAGPLSALPNAPITASLELIFDNDDTSPVTDQRKMYFKWDTMQIDQSSINQAVEDVVNQNLTFISANPTLVYAINNTATEP